jgi:hypothetical protein
MSDMTFGAGVVEHRLRLPQLPSFLTGAGLRFISSAAASLLGSVRL